MGGRLMPPVTIIAQRGSAGRSEANLRAMRGPSARAADGFDDARQLKEGVGAFLEVHAGMGGDAVDYDVPFPDALARGLVGQTLRRFEHVDRGALPRKRFGDGPRSRTADLFVTVEQDDDFAVQQVGFHEQLDCGRRHGHAGLHIESSGAPKAAVAHAAGHGFKRADRPHCVEMAEEEDGLGAFTCARGPRAEAGFENVAVARLAMELEAAAELLEVRGGEGHAGVDGGFCIRGRLGSHEPAGEVEQ
jgi:hypothetical protein